MGETRRGFSGTPIESAESRCSVENNRKHLVHREYGSKSRLMSAVGDASIVPLQEDSRQVISTPSNIKVTKERVTSGLSNTKCIQEGFVPKSFRVLRSQRAKERTQAIQDFYYKDELEEMAQVDITTQVFPATHVRRVSHSVRAQEGYDTFAYSQHTIVREDGT